ncbi:MAG: histidine kinase N-terminal 7TM domain-containing protein, partial [Halodesulfurarchaeum sp.]
MNFVYILHVMIFALSAVLVLASVPRARRISHQRTREGMVVFLLSVGVWSVGYVGYLVLPGRSLKLAFYLVGFVFALVAVAAWVYFSAAYTGRPPRMAPFKRTAVGVFLALLGLKVTNPIHNLYFTSEWASEPFPHLAIQHGIFYWLVLGVSYAVIAVAFWMLIERFYHAGTDTRPLVGLIGLTAVPALATIFGSSIPGMLPLMYEPPGVALFAVGTLFVYFQKFEEIRYAADTDDPTIYLGQNGQIREANAAAIELFPKLADGVQKFLGEVLPEVASQMSEEGVIRRERDGEENFLEVSVNPIKAGDTTTGRLITIRDVTDRERYRRDLEERTEQLELLNRVVRHDIRNDMFVIQGWSETLEEHVDRDGTDALERIQTTSKQIIDLTETARDLLDLVTSQSTPELEPIDLAEQLDIEL